MDDLDQDEQTALKGGKRMEELYPNEERDFNSAIPVFLMFIVLIVLVIFAVSTCNPVPTVGTP